MKFYLTKAAQRAAESGQAPTKAAKAPKIIVEKAPKAEKAPRVEKEPRARKVPRVSKRARAMVDPAADVISPSPVFAAPSERVAPAPWVQTPSAPSADASTLPPAEPTTVVLPPSAHGTTASALLEAPVAPSVEAPARPSGTGNAGRPPKAASESRPKKGVIAIGGQPRVDLLPLEVRAERKAGLVVRRAWFGVAAAVVLVGIATGASTLYASGAAASLTSAQAQTATLTTQASKYSAVKTTQSKVDLIKAAQSVGGSTDVDWSSYLENLALTLPPGVSVTTLSVNSTSPVLPLVQATTPLEGERVATLSFQISADSLPSITAWLDKLTALKGYVDASAQSATAASGGYTASVTLHINQKVFSNTYTKGN